MRIIVYVRVSSVNGDDHETSAAEQADHITTWAQAHGHTIVATYADEGVSGKEDALPLRVGLATTLAALSANEADGVCVYRLDRLARDMVLQERLLGEIRRIGAQAFTTSESEAAFLGDDPKDPSRALIRRILGAVNQYERDMIAMRLAGGKAAKRAHGGYIGGHVPLGKRVVDGELVDDPAGLVAIERMRTLRTEGHSLRAIADILNSEAMPTQRGGRWHAGTVRQALAR